MVSNQCILSRLVVTIIWLSSCPHNIHSFQATLSHDELTCWQMLNHWSGKSKPLQGISVISQYRGDFSEWHPGKQSATRPTACATTRARTHIRARTHTHTYHLHLQFLDLFIQTLLPRLLAGVVRGAQLAVSPERGSFFPHPPEQTLGGLPANFHLYVFQIWDGLAGGAFVHRVFSVETGKKKKKKIKSITSFAVRGNCCPSSCESHFL